MGDSSTFDITKENTFVLRLIWGAIVLAQIVIHAIFWNARLEQEGTREPLAEPVLYIFVAMGTALPLIAGFVARLVARAGLHQAGLMGAISVPQVFPAIVINLALRESGAIFAAVALFLGVDPVLWAVPAAVALGATLVAYPSVAAVKRFTELGADTRRLG